jgi:lipoate-protein ligase B
MIALEPPLREVHVAELGRMAYAAAWDLQTRLVAMRADHAIADHLLLVEHDPVVTLGRKADREVDLRPTETPVPTFEIERGGEATYHAPGQLVGYPILLLEGPERDLHRLLRNLEEVLIRAIARFGVRGERRAKLTGVWVGDRKIASIGVAVRRWVTYHGFALNVSTDLAGFRAIRPCGMEPEVMTSLEVLLGHPVPWDDVVAEVTSQFGAVFGRSIVRSAGLPHESRGALGIVTG